MNTGYKYKHILRGYMVEVVNLTDQSVTVEKGPGEKADSQKLCYPLEEFEAGIRSGIWCPVVTSVVFRHGAWNGTIAIGRMSDNLETELFSFYPDELSFHEAELLNLTARECGELKRRKDREYLQS